MQKQATGYCRLVIEDSVPGVNAAMRAGMSGIGFTGGTHCGQNHAKLLMEAGAMSTFSHMSELPGLVHGSRKEVETFA